MRTELTNAKTTDESAVQFAARSRIHVALAVRDLEQSIAYYRALLGVGPTKLRAGYAKFELDQPSVNLALNQAEGATAPSHPIAHFGVQTKSTVAVQEVARRLEQSGYSTRPEEHVTCCHAVQNKVWSSDPDGNKWEVYVVLDDNPSQSEPTAGACCPDLPAIMDAVSRGEIGAAQAAFAKAGGTSMCSCLSK